jgi:hypothetical protein
MTRLVLFIILCGLISGQLVAQNVGYSVSVGIRKSFNMTKKSSLDLRQQVQLTPDIEKYDNEFGDFFNEEGFWPIPDRYTNDDDQGTPDHNGELDDSPTAIEWEWRSTASWQYNYRLKPWIRANTGYALFYNGEEFRHTLRAELDYRPLRHTSRKKQVDLATRVLWQRVAKYDEEDAEWEWDAFLVPRVDMEWTFKKSHLLVISPALNGAWDDGTIEWDRWRVNTGLTYIYRKVHRFTFSYQYQQRLDKPNRSHGVSLGYEVRL